MVKAKHIRKAIVDYFRREGNKSHTEILNYINCRYKHGVDYHALVNILGKDPVFEKKCVTKVPNYYGAKYNVIVWGLK